ncbi:hypothetical protein [Azospirillum argentinense]
MGWRCAGVSQPEWVGWGKYCPLPDPPPLSQGRGLNFPPLR